MCRKIKSAMHIKNIWENKIRFTQAAWTCIWTYLYEPYTLLCYFIETLPIDNNDNDVLYLCRLLSLEWILLYFIVISLINCNIYMIIIIIINKTIGLHVFQNLSEKIFIKKLAEIKNDIYAHNKGQQIKFKKFKIIRNRK